MLRNGHSLLRPVHEFRELFLNNHTQVALDPLRRRRGYDYGFFLHSLWSHKMVEPGSVEDAKVGVFCKA